MSPNEQATVRRVGQAIAHIRAKQQADIALYSGGIYEPSDTTLIRLVAERREQPNIWLYLNTDGGSPDVAYRMTRCLQRHYKKITVLVRKSCMSAGTLMTLGADEIVMTERAELGPLDVQVRKHDEVGERSSGLTPTQSLNTLREQVFTLFESQFLKLRTRSLFQLTSKTCAEIAAKLTIGVMSPIYAQIDPLRLGELQRALLIAYYYGERLDKGNLKDDALVSLVSGYPSHGFVIDLTEAKSLFNRVRKPTKEEDLLGELLDPLIERGMNQDEAIVEYIAGKAPEDQAKARGRGNGRKRQQKGRAAEKARRGSGSTPAGNGKPQPSRNDQRPSGVNPSANGQLPASRKENSRLATRS